MKPGCKPSQLADHQASESGSGVPRDLTVNFRLEEEKPRESRDRWSQLVDVEANSQGRTIQSEKKIKGILIEQEEVKLTFLTPFTLFLRNLVWRSYRLVG